MSGNLGRLTVDMLMETAQWIAGLNKAEHETDKFVKGIEKKFDEMGDSITSSLKKVAGGIVAAFAVDALVSFGNEIQKTADSLGEMAERTATSVGFLAEMSITAKNSGSSIQGVVATFDKFNKSVNQAAGDPKSDPARIFKALHIELKNADGTIRSSEVLYKEFALAMGHLEDSATKVAAAQKVAGKSAAEQIPGWNALARETSDVAEAHHKYGEAMEKLSPLAGELEEQQSLMNTNMQTMGALIAREILPAFTKLLEQWNEANKQGGQLSSMVMGLVNFFKGLAIAVDFVVTSLMEVITVARAAAMVAMHLKSLEFGAAKETIVTMAADISNMESLAEVRFKSITGTLDVYTKKTFEAGKATQELADASSGAAEAAEKLAEKNKKAAEKAAKEADRALKEAIAQQQKHEREMEKNADQINNGLFDNAITRNNNRIKATEEWLKRELEALKEIGETEKYVTEALLKLSAKATKDLEDQWGGAFKSMESLGLQAFNSIFDSTEGGWSNLMSSMQKEFKKMVVDFIYSSFAKPIVLSLLTNAGGGLGQYAMGQVDNLTGIGKTVASWFGGGMSDGTGGFMATMKDWFSQGGSLTSNAGWGAGWTGVAGLAGGALGGWGAGALGAGERGVQAGKQWGAIGASIGMMTPLGPLGALIGAALGAAIGKFTDPDPDAMRAAVFGSTAGAEGVTPWTGKSALGSFGFSAGEWLSEADMGDSLKEFIKGITAMDNVLASFMSEDQIADVTKRLEEASKRYELGMEHGGVSGLGGIVKDRISIIARSFNEGLGDFVDAFEGSTEDLTSIVSSYVQAAAGGDFDPRKIIADSAPMGLTESFDTQRDSLTEYVAEMDTSAESMAGLVTRMAEFQLTTVQMIAAIDAISAAVHEMFMSTSEQIALSLMTTEQQYAHFQELADQQFAALMASSDPEEIARLSKQINDNILASWNLLDEGQRALLGPEFLSRLAEVDTAVADRLGEIGTSVEEDAGSVMGDIADRLDALFAKAEVTAGTQQAAADTQLVAAQTPITVQVVGGNSSLVTGT